MVSPRKLKSSSLSKGSPFNYVFGVWLIISRWWLWNIMYFVFLTFSDIFLIHATFVFRLVR